MDPARVTPLSSSGSSAAPTAGDGAVRVAETGDGAVRVAETGDGAVRVAETPPAARCPFPHQAARAEAEPAVCPFPHQGASTTPVVRSRADMVVRKVLRIHERPPGVTAASAYSAFQRSMLISATRCTLTYVVFPFVIPLIGIAKGVGPALGIIIGVVAMTCDVFTIRRFFAVDHKWRWQFSAVALSVICLLSILLVQDIAHFVT